MSNPFESGPDDRPLNIHGDNRSAPAGDHAVLFDAANGTGNPASQAFISEMNKHIAGNEKAHLTVVAQDMAAMNKRIVQLVRALKAEAEKYADLLETVAMQFLDDGEMETLNDMAQRHHEKMEAHNANQS
ncbi:hypothetical protein [Sedimentitalea sp.]|uniref:hypothetical protein n=1 Tax=Sedimentitalea sp. TaxID=2048915 RepID=UPI00329828B7